MDAPKLISRAHPKAQRSQTTLEMFREAALGDEGTPQPFLCPRIRGRTMGPLISRIFNEILD